MKNINSYKKILGSEVIDELSQLASFLKNKKIVHINSTKEGGGVAEILSQMVPLTRSLGLNVHWETIKGENNFFQCTKIFHNLLQGQSSYLSTDLLHAYEETNQKNALALKNILEDADFVFIHDPQPLALLSHFPNRKGKWIWRCHIDLSSPSEFVWQYLKKFIDLYDGSVFSLKEFAQKLSHPIYFIPPSIDPLSEKNIELDSEEIQSIFHKHKIDPTRRSILQVSRFDRFKDPLGVIEAYNLAKINYPDLQLILAGGGAIDDPEGAEVLQEVQKKAANNLDIRILLLPPTAHRTINALQRGANIVLQKSLKEGFGLTVSEALWKSKPVIGGNTGGIKLQVIDAQTGFLVGSPQEAANRIAFLLQHPDFAQKLGKNGKKLVKNKFLIIRHLKDYLSVMAFHLFPDNKELATIVENLR